MKIKSFWFLTVIFLSWSLISIWNRMEYMQSCASDDNASNVSDKEFHQRAVRSVYLVTYSRADMTKFTTPKSFCEQSGKVF